MEKRDRLLGVCMHPSVSGPEKRRRRDDAFCFCCGGGGGGEVAGVTFRQSVRGAY